MQCGSFREIADVIKNLQLNVLVEEFLKKFYKSSEKFLKYSKGFRLGKGVPLLSFAEKRGHQVISRPAHRYVKL